MPNIRICARAGPGWGTGHVRRAGWLAEALSEQRWCDNVELRLDAQGPEADGLRHGDILICDLLDNDADTVRELTRAGLKLVLLDDYGAAQREANLVVNTLLAPLESSEDWNGRGRILSGIKWLQLAPSLTRLRGVATAVAKAMETELAESATLLPPQSVLLSFGGLPHAGAAQFALDALADADCNARVTVTPAPEDLRLPAALDVELRGGGDDFPDLLSAADLIVCAGGITLYEAAFLGIPAVCIAVAEHQEATGRKLAAAGSCVYAGSAEAESTDKLSGTLFALLHNPHLRGRMSAAGQRLIDGYGLPRTVQAIGELAAMG